MAPIIAPISEATIDSYNGCLSAVAQERLWLGLVGPADLERSRSFVRANIQLGNPHYVAMDDERVVGWCDITRNKLEGFRHCGELGMGVLKEYRGQGIGERLARAALQQARVARLERVELVVYASNEPAIKLYEKLGFSVEGLHRRARKLDGRYDDVISMALLFEPKLDSLGREVTETGFAAGTIGDLSMRVGEDVRDLHNMGYDWGQITNVARGRMTLEEMWKQGPRRGDKDQQ
ncbi:MAG: GNAT family N-acetyltransferase [Anaerolineae bacterium]|nr:GNAT family N-acetyltransferase [Anaerolineae bacterium]